MRKLFFILLITAAVSCNTKQSEKPTIVGENELTAGELEVIADTITYDVIINATDPTDAWTQSCLSHLKREEFINIIFEKIEKGQLIAYDYETNEPISFEQIQNKKIENDNKMVIGKIQFKEIWAFDKSQMRMIKKVHSAIFGYETYLDGGIEVRGHKAAFKIFFK